MSAVFASHLHSTKAHFLFHHCKLAHGSEVTIRASPLTSFLGLCILFFIPLHCQPASAWPFLRCLFCFASHFWNDISLPGNSSKLLTYHHVPQATGVKHSEDGSRPLGRYHTLEKENEWSSHLGFYYPPSAHPIYHLDLCPAAWILG
jgi:hypothetical protein